MAIQKINLGTEPHGVGGDSYRTANEKINSNFDEVGKDIKGVLDVVQKGDFAKSAYDIAVKNGFVGTESAWLSSLIGQKGEKGVGVVNVIHNNDDTLTFNFTDNTRYTTRSLKGDQGIQGPEAKSVYDIAVSHGFKGNEKDWLNYILENSETVSDLFADADSLEKFVSGSDSETVLTRLSAKYPTLQKALKELFENNGIAGRFKTVEQLQTKGTDLPDGSYALVADDTDDKNGVYIKEAGAWVKSKYDPLSRALNELNTRIALDGSDNLKIEVDKNGKIYSITDKDGELYLTGLDESVQKSIKKNKNVDDSHGLLKVLDANGKVAMALSSKGVLTVPSISTLDSNKKELDIINKITAYSNKAADFAIAANTKRVNTKHEIASIADYGADQLSSGMIARLDKNRYMMLYGVGKGRGDFVVAETNIYFKIITVNTDYSISVSDDKLIATGGTDANGSYGASVSNITVLKTGEKKGRIIASLLHRWGEDKDDTYIIYSDDMGVSWSNKIPLRQFIPKYSEWRLSVGSPGKGIQIQNGKYKGRIVLPYWHATQQYPNGGDMRSFLLYSDDNGVTYKVGAETQQSNTSECIVAECPNDTLMILIRDDSNKTKVQSFSYDGGVTMQDLREVTEVNVADVACGLLNTQNQYDLSLPKLIMTSPTGSRREKIAVYYSYDFEHFEGGHVITDEIAAYSDAEVSDEGHILIAWEDAYRQKAFLQLVDLKTIFKGVTA